MKIARKLSPTTVVQWDPEQVTTEIGGEVLAMSIREGVYVGLDPVASSIWKRLANAQTVAALCTQLASEYDGDPEVIAGDVVQLLGELCEYGMLTTRPGEAVAGGQAAA